MKEKNICCICGCEIDGFGNNPDPIAPPEKDCCDVCNMLYVIPARCGNVIAREAALELMRKQSGQPAAKSQLVCEGATT